MAKFVVEGKETERENLLIQVVLGQQKYSIELLFNKNSLLDVDEVEYELQMRNSKNELVDSDRWFGELYKRNEVEVGDAALLKNRRIYEAQADLYGAYQALKSKKTVHNLKIIAILGSYYFLGKDQDADFFLAAIPDLRSKTYTVTYFMLKAHRGVPAVMFLNRLFDSYEDLPNDEDFQ